MATSIITGRDITFTIDGDTFDAQATSATLTIDSTVNTYQTLDGKAYYTTDTQGTFNVELLQDFGAATSLCEALWNAAASTPNTALPVLFTVNGVASGQVGTFSTLAVNVLGFWCYATSTLVTFQSLTAAGASATNSPAIFGNSAAIRFSVTFHI